MDENQRILELVARYGHITDTMRVIHIFRGYRNHNRITVQILDSGVIGDSNRYLCLASREDTGFEARSNHSATIDEAVAIVHWSSLDS